MPSSEQSLAWRESLFEPPPKIRDLKVTLTPIALLNPSLSSARTRSKKHVDQIAKSIETFGWTNPILIDENNRVRAVR